MCPRHYYDRFFFSLCVEGQIAFQTLHFKTILVEPIKYFKLKVAYLSEAVERFDKIELFCF